MSCGVGTQGMGVSMRVWGQHSGGWTLGWHPATLHPFTQLWGPGQVPSLLGLIPLCNLGCLQSSLRRCLTPCEYLGSFLPPAKGGSLEGALWCSDFTCGWSGCVLIGRPPRQREPQGESFGSKPVAGKGELQERGAAVRPGRAVGWRGDTTGRAGAGVGGSVQSS